MRVLFAAGGTAGHINPDFAIFSINNITNKTNSTISKGVTLAIGIHLDQSSIPVVVVKAGSSLQLGSPLVYLIEADHLHVSFVLSIHPARHADADKHE